MSLLLSFLPLWINTGPYLSWVNDPQTTITVSWQTAIAESSILEYGLDTTDTDTIINPILDTLHSIEITNLEPANKYYYCMKLDSGFHSFKTADTGQTPFTFCVLGDTRTDSVAHQSVVDRIVAIKPDFVLHVGDYVYNGSSVDDWNTFFNIERNLMSLFPFMSSIGNHEWPFALYFEMFNLPGNEKWYSFNYSNAHFICLDTDDSLTGTQRIWLENDLLSVSMDGEIDWIFVYFHRPPYSKSKNGWQSDTVVRNTWCNLFEMYGVDLVLNGQNHFYQRTNAINGVTYIVTGGGGAPLYEPDTANWIAYSEKAYHCCKIEVNGPSLKMYAIASDGTVFDSLIMVCSCEEKRDSRGASGYLYQNHPNLFTRFTSIKYYIPIKSKISLKIYDMSGKIVKTLVDESKEAGCYTAKFTAQDFPSGIYFASFSAKGGSASGGKAGDYKETKKLILVR